MTEFQQVVIKHSGFPGLEVEKVTFCSICDREASNFMDIPLRSLVLVRGNS